MAAKEDNGIAFKISLNSRTLRIMKKPYNIDDIFDVLPD
jgi:hypothetical protein